VAATILQIHQSQFNCSQHTRQDYNAWRFRGQFALPCCEQWIPARVFRGAFPFTPCSTFSGNTPFINQGLPQAKSALGFHLENHHVSSTTGSQNGLPNNHKGEKSCQ
jgi:hypothetical protein